MAAQPDPEPRPRRRSGAFGRTVVALSAGLVGGLLAPLVYPAVAARGRPLAKRAMKAGVAAFERGREAAAELGERTSDLFAEARAEYDSQHEPPAEQGAAPRTQEVVRLRGSGREAAGP